MERCSRISMYRSSSVRRRRHLHRLHLHRHRRMDSPSSFRRSRRFLLFRRFLHFRPAQIRASARPPSASARRPNGSVRQPSGNASALEGALEGALEEAARASNWTAQSTAPSTAEAPSSSCARSTGISTFAKGSRPGPSASARELALRPADDQLRAGRRREGGGPRRPPGIICVIANHCLVVDTMARGRWPPGRSRVAAAVGTTIFTGSPRGLSLRAAGRRNKRTRFRDGTSYSAGIGCQDQSVNSPCASGC